MPRNLLGHLMRIRECDKKIHLRFHMCEVYKSRVTQTENHSGLNLKDG